MLFQVSSGSFLIDNLVCHRNPGRIFRDGKQLALQPPILPLIADEIKRRNKARKPPVTVIAVSKDGACHLWLEGVSLAHAHLERQSNGPVIRSSLTLNRKTYDLVIDGSGKRLELRRWKLFGAQDNPFG